jgi:hypothetical protein
MEGRQLLQYIIDTSDVVLAKKQEATEYLAQLESRPTKDALDAVYCPQCEWKLNSDGSCINGCVAKTTTPVI